MLVDPGPNPDMLSELMKALAARTTRHRNRKDKRSGTLWESRYCSSVVQRGYWTLACLRYLEKRPVLLDMATAPSRFPWTSFGMRMGRDEPAWLDHPEEFLELADEIVGRQEDLDDDAGGLRLCCSVPISLSAARLILMP